MLSKSLAFVAIICLLLLPGACGNKDNSSSALAEDTLSELPVSPDLPEMAEPEREPVKVAPTTTEGVLAMISDSGEEDKYARGIIPRMAKEVPEYAGKLMVSDAEGFLIVDKKTMKIYRYDRYGVEQERMGMACSKRFGSKHKRRDNRTPEGYFTIEGIYDSTDWLFTDDDGNTSEVKGQFGPRFMRLRTPVSSQIGIHGTVAPWSIGGRRSHGCIRVLNENILRLAEICKPGWPVIVSPGPTDMKVNEDEGYDIPAVSVAPDLPRAKAGKWNPEEEREKKEEAAREAAAAKEAADSTASEHQHPLESPLAPAGENTSGEDTDESVNTSNITITTSSTTTDKELQ